MNIITGILDWYEVCKISEIIYMLFLQQIIGASWWLRTWSWCWTCPPPRLSIPPSPTSGCVSGHHWRFLKDQIWRMVIYNFDMTLTIAHNTLQNHPGWQKRPSKCRLFIFVSQQLWPLTQPVTACAAVHYHNHWSMNCTPVSSAQAAVMLHCTCTTHVMQEWFVWMYDVLYLSTSYLVLLE